MSTPMQRWQGEPLDIESAYRHIMLFADGFGPAAALLAAHCAVLERIRPESLALIRQNFLLGPDRWKPHLDADVLFGPLTRELGGGYFVMDKEVRRQLLGFVDAWGSRRGEQNYRSSRVARMVRQYVELARRTDPRANSTSFDDYLNVINWTALAYDDPHRAASALVRMIDAKIRGAAGASKIRFTGVSELLELPMSALLEELQYAQGVDALWDGEITKAAALFKPTWSRQIEFGGVALPAANALLARYQREADASKQTARVAAPTGVESAPTSLPNSGMEQSAETMAKAGPSPLLDSELHRLTKDNDLAAIAALLLEGGVDVDAQGLEGKTPLHLAASLGRPDIARLLIEAGAKVDSLDSLSATPLFEAAGNGHLEVAQLLVANKADVNARNSQRRTPMTTSVYYGHEAIVALLIANSAAVSGATRGEYLPVCAAAMTARRKLLRRLEEHGAALIATNEKGATLLHFAAAGGDPEILARVLKAGYHSIADRDGSGWTALHWAAYYGRDRTVAMLLEFGMDVSARESLNWTALHIAAFMDDPTLCRTLLNYGALPEATIGLRGYTPLHIAAHNNSARAAEVLLNAGADPNKVAFGFAPLSIAAAKGFAPTIRALVANPATDLGVEDAQGRKAMLLAVEAKDGDAVAALLAHPGVERNETSKLKNDKSGTPLWRAIELGTWDCAALLCADPLTDISDRADQSILNKAAEKGSAEVVSRLLQRGADPNRGDKQGDTPLRAAIAGGNAEVIAMLARAGGDLQVRDRQGGSLLHFAVQIKSGTAVHALVDLKLDIESRDLLGRTPLHLAASDNMLELLQLLLRLGADPICRDRRGLTPLHLAVQAGASEVAETLVSAGPVDATTHDGWTPLHFAAQRNLLSVAEALLDKGADVNLVSTLPPLTPLQAAAEAGSLELCKRLLAAQADKNSGNATKGPPLLLAIQNGHYQVAIELLRGGADAKLIEPRSGATLAQSLESRRNLDRLAGAAADPQVDLLADFLADTTQPLSVLLDDLQRRQRPKPEEPPPKVAAPTPPASTLSGTTLLAGLNFRRPDEPVGHGWYVEGGDGKRRFLQRALPAAQAHDEAFIRDTQVAWRPLPFYEQVCLCRVRHRQWPHPRMAHFYLLKDDQLFRLTGGSPVVHEVNAKAPLKLNEKNVLDYARFFCFFVHGEGGPFMFLEDSEDEALARDLSATTRELIRGNARTANFPGMNTQGHFLVDAVIAYSDALFIANFSIQPSGMVEMLDDEPVAANIGKLIDAPIA